MCLTITVTAPADEQERLQSAAQKVEAIGLQMQTTHQPRWRWGRAVPVRAVISEDGGCACGFLNDDADWDAATWAMQADAAERLAKAIEIVAAEGPSEFSLEALWVGDSAQDVVTLSSKELIAHARSSTLGTRTKYQVVQTPGHAGVTSSTTERLEITEEVALYREAARHLWNSAFHTTQPDWDTRDSFSRVATELFTALVLEPIRYTKHRLPRMSEAEPAHFRHIAVVAHTNDVPIMVNRSSESSGYWDDPVTRVRRDEAELRFVTFFDWNELGQRDFKFVLVRIVGWPAHPQLVDRYALLEFQYVQLYLLADPASSPDDARHE